MLEMKALRSMHEQHAEHLNRQVAELGASAAGPFHVAIAVHRAAATFAASCVASTDMTGEMQELNEDFQALSEAVDAHQGAIQRAQSGLAPWGEILAAGDRLKQIVAKVLSR